LICQKLGYLYTNLVGEEIVTNPEAGSNSSAANYAGELDLVAAEV